MANYQVGYGHGDVAAFPFDFYSGAVDVLTGLTFNMQTGVLVLFPAGAVTETVVLPLNPPDGALAEISNALGSGGTVTLTVNANTGDVFKGTQPSAFALTAGTTVKLRYSLNGDIGQSIAPRAWVRIA